jgi:nucleotide-binding universal stress UspA family protein
MSTNAIHAIQTPVYEVQADHKICLNKIMVMTDFTPASDLALDYALALARRYDSCIYLAHVITPPDSYPMVEPSLATMTYEKMRQAAEQGIADILISGQLRGVPHEVLLREGSLWPAVERLIAENGIDLVVTGTHGRGEFKKFFVGSVAEEVFRQADCPVLTVGPHTPSQAPREEKLNTILFPTDYGPGAARAAKYAFSLAQEHGAQLTMLHVVEQVAPLTREDEALVRKANVERMKQFTPPGVENWCKVEFRVTFGAPVEEVLAEARETHADLILMGAKARKAFAGHSPLSIAYKVVAQAKCPVMTVRG